MDWTFQDPREVIPWMFLKLTPRSQDGKVIIVVKGLCAPEAPAGPYQESWRLVPSDKIPEGRYGVEAFFFDNTRLAWGTKSGQRDVPKSLLAPAVPLGELNVTAGKIPARK
jgi:hypothetical protein